MILNVPVKKIMACVFMMLLLGLSSQAADPKQEITIAIIPCTDVITSFTKFHPFVTYLNEVTHIKTRLIFHQDFEAYERSIKNGELDFALQDPHVYVKLAELYDKTSLLQVLTPEGKKIQAGVVIVNKESGMNKLDDLRGKTVMFGPRVSSARWMAARLLFKENGINIDKDLKGYSHGGCCEDVAFNVYLKAVEAGVICDHFLTEQAGRQMNLGVDTGRLVVIGKTKSVPAKVFAATKRTEPDLIDKVNSALLNLDTNPAAYKKILNDAELGGFVKARDQDFDEIRKVLNAMSED